MNVLWIVIGVGIVGAGVAAVGSWYRSSQAADLGSVSHQWIAERRAGQRYDAQR